MTTFKVGDKIRFTTEFRNNPCVCADGKIHEVTNVEAVSNSPHLEFRKGLEEAVGHPQWITLDGNVTVSGVNVEAA